MYQSTYIFGIQSFHVRSALQTQLHKKLYDQNHSFKLAFNACMCVYLAILQENRRSIYIIIRTSKRSLCCEW